MTPYNLEKLVLLNSGPMNRGIFAIDNSLTISGENNNGKTSIINALQFLLLAGTPINQMNFGEHSTDATKQWYFSGEYSYVLISLRTARGSFVIGAVGKGAEHAFGYELFIYKKDLRLEHYENDKGEYVNRKELFRNLQQMQPGSDPRVVEPKELQALLRGEVKGKATDSLQAFTLAKGVRPTVFSKIFSNLLHMKKIDNALIKEQLLEIFDLNSTATHKLSEKLENVAAKVSEYKISISECDSVLYKGRRIVDSYKDMVSAKEEYHHCLSTLKISGPHYSQRLENQISEYNERQRSHQMQINHLQQESKTLSNELNEITPKLWEVERENKRQQNLESKYGELPPADEKAFLYQRIHKLEDDLKGASRQSSEDVRIKLRRLEHTLKSRAQDLLRIREGSTILNCLQEHYSKDDLQSIMKIYNQDLFAQSRKCLDSLEVFKEHVKDILSCIDAQMVYRRNGLCLDLKLIDTQSLLDIKELEETISTLKRDIGESTSLLKACENREEVEKEKQALLQKLEANEKALTEYKDLQQLKSDQENRAANEQSLSKQKKALTHRQEVISAQVSEQTKCSRDLGEEITTLGRKKGEFVSKMQEIDFSLVSGEAADLVDDCSEHMALQLEFKTHYKTMAAHFEGHKSSLFESTNKEARSMLRLDDDEKTIAALEEYLESGEEKKRMFSNSVTESFNNLLGSLESLEKNCRTLRRKVKAFNEDINKYKISNLQSLRLEAHLDSASLQAISDFSENCRSLNGEISLFAGEMDFGTVLEKFEKLCKNLLLRRDKLVLTKLFDLYVEVVNADGSNKRYRNLDVESTGTTLVIKTLVSLLMMNALLEDSTRRVSIPYYIDEAQRLDAANLKTLVDASKAMGFTPIFASVQPVRAYYHVHIPQSNEGTKLTIDYERDHGDFLKTYAKEEVFEVMQ